MSWPAAVDLRARLRGAARGWGALLAVGVLAVAVFGDPLDLNRLRDSSWVSTHRGAVRALTEWGPYPLYLLFLGMLAWGWRCAPALKTLALGYVLAQLFGSVAIVRSLKILLGRARPDLVLDGGAAAWIGPTLQAAYHSFPSGHVADLATGVIFIVVAFRGRWTTALAIGWGVLVAATRIVLAKHYLSDVVGGLAAGGLAALAVLYWWVLPRIASPRPPAPASHPPQEVKP